MGLIANLKADRLISQISSAPSALDDVAQKAVAKLKEMGPDAIDPIIEALGDADKQATLALVDALSALADEKSFNKLVDALTQVSTKTASAIAGALAASRSFPPTRVLEALSKPNANRSALLDVINAHRSRISVREMLRATQPLDASDKNALFRIIGEVADESAMPELIARLGGKDATSRLHIIRILGRFNKPEAAAALQSLLGETSKLVRTAALTAMAGISGPYDVKLLCQQLRDPELEVSSRAVDVLVKYNDPHTTEFLLPVLSDESEIARRAAVEVLNVVGDARSVKSLLKAIKDSDWWVRSRAGDALGRIGGPKVIDAVLELSRDQDQNIRRTAIEILVHTKDARAVQSLIKSTHDADWWVCERAVDALGEIGSRDALPRLTEMLKTDDVKKLAAVIRAIGRIGDARHFDLLLPFKTQTAKEVRTELLTALARLVDEPRSRDLRDELNTIGQTTADATIGRAAVKAMTEIDVRFASGVLTRTQVGQAASTDIAAGSGSRAPVTRGTSRVSHEKRSSTTVSMLLTEDAAAGAADTIPTPPVLPPTVVKLDITTLNPGDVVDNRYKYMQKIGKGAFGTVLLMEDTVVGERLILKFLNQNVAEDAEVMKRFVHELRYSRKITHRNVIRIYDFLSIQGLYAISMEYFPSHTLGSEVVNEKPLPLKRAVRFGIDLCTGMTVAHQVGIVHRDLKPANVLINDEGLLKIVDFGVAAAHSQADTQLTKTGYVIGSPKYMAPEQILGKKVDERADVYAVGVILYEILTGIPPYSRGDHMSVMYQHVQGKARLPAEVNPQLPPGLSELIMKAMAVDKTKRFQSMDELRVALEKYV
jgi:eukaryotic-like serine/threonine-protein kinase